MRDLNDAFGKALRDLRLGANLAQTDFPPKVSREYVSLLERGVRSPSLETIDDLAGVIGVHPLTLVLQCYLTREPETNVKQLLDEVQREIRLEMI
ncbi:helix-turn-helix domain-containing protein [Pseudomonas sp. CR3202]|uniref:helix-turn-helix domain-containing protein n=1 Tax=Pseudomonas sp. CR3202 TaxID=3351532 RepID=UPI003BF1FC61